MMKKIFGLILISCFCCLGYSYGALYTNNPNCSGNGKFYDNGGNFVCGSCEICTGHLYGSTGFIGCGYTGYSKCCNGNFHEGSGVCCDISEQYDPAKGKCVINCSAGTYYGKNQDKCCATSSGYIAYDWKKKGRTGNVWYYDDCDEGVLYKKGANDVKSKQVDVDSLGSGVNSYSFCGKGNVVTENGRCIPCAGAANLSGIRIHPDSTINCHIVCSENEVAFTGASGAPGCCPGTVKDGVCHQELLKMGVRVNNACLIDGQCGLNIYRILGIRASDNYDPSVSNVASDIINAAISFMGTVVTIVFVVAGIICSMNSISGKDTKKMMKVFVDSAVGMLMVWGSYAIIRLVQFIATAGS